MFQKQHKLQLVKQESCSSEIVVLPTKDTRDKNTVSMIAILFSCFQ
jgi:hypothetical protein